jgi:3-mercaptopyruvate sulfurtransferase SseA
VNVDVFSYGAQDLPAGEMERRMQAWGISAGKKIVLYDQGGTFMASRLFFDLYYYGVPAQNLHILDGGLAKWQELGRAVTKEPTVPPAGTFRVSAIKEDARVRLPAFLVASGDPKQHALIEALEPSHHFGEAKFFDRAGHVPNAIMMPTADFYNADKTFKSAAELQRMLTFFGIRPEQQIHTYCGGGVAASVPFFALKFVLKYPDVRLYKESQLEWLRDDRGLPLWTYGAPYLKRDMNWLNSWSNRMTRQFGVSKLSVIDVRSADAYRLGHVPFSVNVPTEAFRKHLQDPQGMAEVLGAAGVNPNEEAVIVSDSALNPRSALAFLMLERLGQKKVSVLMGSVDEWGLSGLPLTKEAAADATKSPPETPARPTNYRASLRPDLMIRDPATTKGAFPKVYVAAGKNLPARVPDGKVVHVPYTELLNADGTPKAAKDIWNVLVKAGVPRYAEIVCIADDPGEAAVNYFVLKLMGYPDVRVLVP